MGLVIILGLRLFASRLRYDGLVTVISVGLIAARITLIVFGGFTVNGSCCLFCSSNLCIFYWIRVSVIQTA